MSTVIRIHHPRRDALKGIGRKAPVLKIDWTMIARSGALRPIVSPRRL